MGSLSSTIGKTMEGVVAGAPSDLPDGAPRFNGPTKAHAEFVDAMKRYHPSLAGYQMNSPGARRLLLRRQVRLQWGAAGGRRPLRRAVARLAAQVDLPVQGLRHGDHHPDPGLHAGLQAGQQHDVVGPVEVGRGQPEADQHALSPHVDNSLFTEDPCFMTKVANEVIKYAVRRTAGPRRAGRGHPARRLPAHRGRPPAGGRHTTSTASSSPSTTRAPTRSFPLTEGWIDGDVVECALHMAKFCITSGEALCLPANRDLAVHDVDVVDGEVWVTIHQGGAHEPTDLRYPGAVRRTRRRPQRGPQVARQGQDPQLHDDPRLHAPSARRSTSGSRAASSST